jgi:choloylglycine hydrolase
MLALSLALSLAQPALACTDIVLKGQPGVQVSARTIDFEQDLEEQFVFVRRNQSWQSPAPGGAEGFAWTNRYGFVGLQGLDKITNYFDGVNETGLAAAILWLDVADYPKPANAATALSINDVVGWILGELQVGGRSAGGDGGRHRLGPVLARDRAGAARASHRP